MRWTKARKYKVVSMIKNSHLSHKAACFMYGVSHEELQEWMVKIENKISLKATVLTPKELRRAGN